MKIAFQKNPQTFLEKSICNWTNSPYFHTELVFNDGWCFSADFAKNTTRFKYINFNDNWDYKIIPVTARQEIEILKWCLSEDKCGYDYIGIVFTQIIPLSFENPWWWFCSEVCLAAIQQVNYFKGLPAYQYNPGKLYHLLEDFENE